MKSELSAPVAELATGTSKGQREAAKPADRDTTGRKQLAGSVLTSWLAQLVFIAAGFVMPRMIDQRLGQEMLGVWDFAWSIIGYFGLVQLGVVGSVNRYVAMHRAEGDMAAVNRCVSSVLCVLWVMAGLILALAALAAFFVPRLMVERVGQHQTEVAWVILFLGLSCATQTAASAHAGVLTGCHQWKLHNSLSAGSYAVTVVAMVAALMLGYGIRALAFVYFCGELGQALVRIAMASRVCPGLHIRLGNADWLTARSMIGFGGKSYIPQISDLLLNQTLNVMIVAYLGPAALALYSRPRSLVLQARTLVFKMAGVIMPSVSSLQAVGEHEKIQDLLIKGTRYAAYLTLPITATMLIMGGPLLHIWMGPQYANPWLMVVFAIGYTSYIIQVPTIAILGGMNLHGRAAAANFICSIVTVALVALVIGKLKLGLEWVALAAVGPLSLLYAIYIPWHACHRVSLPFSQYFRKSLAQPFFHLIPFVIVVAIARVAMPSQPLAALVVGACVGSLVLIPIYWRKVLPDSVKASIRRKCTWI